MFVSIYLQTKLLEKTHTLVEISTQVHVFMVLFLALTMWEDNQNLHEI